MLKFVAFRLCRILLVYASAGLASQLIDIKSISLTFYLLFYDIGRLSPPILFHVEFYDDICVAA